VDIGGLTRDIRRAVNTARTYSYYHPPAIALGLVASEGKGLGPASYPAPREMFLLTEGGKETTELLYPMLGEFGEWLPPFYLHVISKVYIALKPAPGPWVTRLFDVDYVYKLRDTLSVESFRKNAERAESRKLSISFQIPSDTPEVVPQIAEWLMNWYKNRLGQTHYDFGYVMWIAWNMNWFNDLRVFLAVDRKYEVRGVSVIGKLCPGRAIHLICKADDVPYLSDFLRRETYYWAFSEKGYEYVHDGSDVGLPGLRKYKLKLRPRFILPIYSWFKLEGVGNA